jgi:hypothetical protein
MAYNTYAKRWSAKSGKYSTTGRITWSEIVPGKKHALISYSYHVDGTLYNGEYRVNPFRIKETVEKNPKGKEIKVFYSYKAPSFSNPNYPPSHSQIIGSTFMSYLFVPLIVINFIFMYVYLLSIQ